MMQAALPIKSKTNGIAKSTEADSNLRSQTTILIQA
jgi:hypothetical protein